MHFELSIALIFLIIFFAATIRSTFGFGDALIAMPCLALIMNIKEVTPIVAFIGFFMSLFMLIKSFKFVYFKDIKMLLLFSIIGIPLGIIYLKEVNESLIKIILAAVLILFSIYNLVGFQNLELKTQKSSIIFGLISGMLGGAYNVNGPPIIIYGSLRKWNPENFRIILQVIFFPTNLFIIIGHGIAGFWTTKVIEYTAYSIPVLILAYFTGSMLHKFIPKDKYQSIIYSLLLIIGLTLLIQTIIKII